MIVALVILNLLILVAPFIVIFDGPVIRALIAAAAAVTMAIVGGRIRPGEAGFLSTAIGPAAIIAFVPAIWMLIQVIPSQNAGLAHPIWRSAEAALGHRVAGEHQRRPRRDYYCVRPISFTGSSYVCSGSGSDRSAACRMGPCYTYGGDHVNCPDGTCD